jgi:hypothetical protein
MHSSSTFRYSDARAENVSPLMLSHELLSLAEEAHRAGMPQSATRLLRLAHTVCNDRPRAR